ncbi:hypothetical protein NL676_037188 [Syzygium grande]|nr:hypothetical protein NL676_037188 [Syzygium grande]
MALRIGRRHGGLGPFSLPRWTRDVIASGSHLDLDLDRCPSRSSVYGICLPSPSLTAETVQPTHVSSWLESDTTGLNGPRDFSPRSDQ